MILKDARGKVEITGKEMILYRNKAHT